MQKSLKRALSLLLAVVMIVAVFAIAPVSASAAETGVAASGDEETISIGDTKTVTVPALTSVYLQFVPEESVCIGYYLTDPNSLYGICVSDASKQDLDGDNRRYVDIYDGEAWVRTIYKFNVTAGRTYYIHLNGAYEDRDAEVNLTSFPEWEHDGGTITAYNGDASSVVIPSELDGEEITAIGEKAFYGLKSLTEVTIPEGIASIGEYAFYDCGLTSVTFPESLAEINDYAFYGCPMCSVDLPESVAIVGENAFYYNDSNTKDGFLQFVTVRNNSGEGTTFSEYAFGPTSSIKLFQCYENYEVYSNLAANEDAPFYGKTAYLSEVPEEEPATVTFMVSEDQQLSTAHANGAVTMPEIGTVTNGERVFVGWSTFSDAAVPVFEVGETYPIIGSVTLYAVWNNVVKFYDEDETTLLGTYIDVAATDGYSTYYSNETKVICENVQIPDKSGKALRGFYKDDTRYFYWSGNQWEYPTYINRPNDFDDNGVCKLVAKWKEVEDVFVGRSVSLDGVIRLNVYVKAGAADNIQAFNTDVESRETYSGTGRDSDYDKTKRSVEVDGNTYDKISFKIYAKEMADNIRVVYSGYDYTTYEGYTIVKNYSVKDYLETLAADAVTYADTTEKAAELRDICYATLNYGAAAQRYFKHKTDLLANANVPASYTPAQPTDLAYDAGSQVDYEYVNLSYYASSMGLFADTSYALCFEYLNGDDHNSAPYLMYFKPFASDYEGEGGVEYNGVWGDWVSVYAQTVGYHEVNDPENGGSYKHYMIAYVIPDIAAKDLLNDIPVYFQAQGSYDDEWNWHEGTAYNDDEHRTVFSPKTYIAKVLNAAGANPDYTDGTLADDGTYNSKEQQEMNDLVNTVRAIYDYSVKASAYFG